MRCFSMCVGAVAAFTVPGCFLAADLGRFEGQEGCDLALELRSFDFHAPSVNRTGDKTFFRLVTTVGAPSLRAHAILDPFPATDIDLTLPGAVPPGVFNVDFFSDVDGNDVFSPPLGAGGGADHSWTLEDVCARPPVRFVHDTFFDVFDEPVTAPNALEIAFENMLVGGGALEVQVVELALEGDEDPLSMDRTIGLYRLGAVVAANPSIRIPGILDPGPQVRYQLRIFADQNGDDEYQPGVDESWVLVRTGEELTAGQFVFDRDARATDLEDLGEILVRIRRR